MWFFKSKTKGPTIHRTGPRTCICCDFCGRKRDWEIKSRHCQGCGAFAWVRKPIKYAVRAL